MQTHVWRNLHVELPADWEMLQFSRQAAAGRCAFADRYQFRLELVWRAVPGPPDLERMMADYLAKLRADGDTAEARRVQVASWPGLAAPAAGANATQTRRRLSGSPPRSRAIMPHAVPTSRFGAYLAAESCVVEVVFLWPDGRDAALEERVLESVRAEPPRADGSRRWRAFGMDLLASKGLPLAACRVEPARATLFFAEDGGARHERFQRLGLVDEWLEGSVGEWLAAQVPKGGRIRSQWPIEAHDHKLALLTGTRPVRRLGGLITRPMPFEAAAWRCPQDGRLYCATVTHPGPAAGKQAAQTRRLSCCPLMELSP